MSKFRSNFVTKRIQNEILADAAKLAAATLPYDISQPVASRPQPEGLMLEIRFNPQREPDDWLRVAFVNRFETNISNYAYRIGYDGACCGLPVTRAVLAHSISTRIFPPFEKMIRSGLRQKAVAQWVVGVTRLAEAAHNFDTVLANKLWLGL
ncbi:MULTISPECIES: hypothetical protein [Rhizobium]|uniref:hypothetical protein n=1 Tax=Rhizobium TaxID=379 RepID=UPI001030CAE9|nr:MULTISPECIES: hypothetical protein [Rhizobium]TAX30754.1 hypothetical protein ELI04_13710 [Rhizobium leguminosarum]TBD43298.1 hypothetical protein ELH19_14250 [Rhizobium ruizarguesonis]